MSVSGPVEGFWAVIPAGGAGARLWPLSRSGSPKFLRDLTGSGRSMLQTTVDRLEPLCGPRMLVVTGVAHEVPVRAQLPQLRPEHILAEPASRDSMAAIGLAAAVVERHHPDAVIGSFAADHVISSDEQFHGVVREAIAVADTNLVATIGIRPSFAATGFGYIRAADALRVAGAPHAYRAASFVEKPDATLAEEYLHSGRYRWNAGMFVVKAGVLLDLLATHHPDFAAGLRAIATDPDRLDAVWAGLPRISIDHAIAEPAAADGRVAVVFADFGWDDVGDFDSLADLVRRGPDEDVTVLGPAQVLARDASGLVAGSGERLVALLGVEDIVVVDTPDALLVTTRARAQDVKTIVDALTADGRTDLT